MDMPGYTDYGKMYEMNPGAFWQAQDQVGLAKQFQQGRQDRQTIDNQSAGLDAMFKADTYGDRVRQGTAAADLATSQASDAAIKNRINSATEGLQLDAQQKKLVMEASESELKRMENLGQQWAYSTDPAQRKAGEDILKMHKDFIKLRETQSFTAGESAKERAHRMALQKQAQDAMMARQQALAKAKADAKAGTEKMTTDQLRAHYIKKAEEARMSGDYEAANALYQEAQYITQLRAAERPDTQAGRIDAGVVSGLPTVPPREMPQPPIGQPAAPTQPRVAPNARAVEYLRKNPQLAAEFDRKYGQGASASVLGNR